LAASDITGFVLAASARYGSGSLNNVTTGLRAFLRFLYVQGYTATSLAAAVLTAPGWRDGGMPRAATPDQVARLLASCDRRTAVGRRDFAILTVLARLGLRAREVAALCLDDVDWRAGEVVVCGKGNRRERLPLPHDVGQAIAEYCRRGRTAATAAACFCARTPPTPRCLPAGSASWSPGPAAAPACPAWVRTGCGMPRPRRCVVLVRRCTRSARSCGIVTRCPRRITLETTTTR
jgi:site-specific recombinase XerC